MLRGIGVCDGICIAKAIQKKEKEIDVELKVVHDIEKEVERVNNAVYKYMIQLEKAFQTTLDTLGEVEASMYQSQLHILKDSVVVGGVKKLIREKGYNAEYVLFEVQKKYEAIYKRMEDDFLKKKAGFIRTVTNGLIKILNNISLHPFEGVQEPFVIVAKELSASDILEVDTNLIKGIILEHDGANFHSLYIAKNLHVPVVINVKKVLHKIATNDQVAVNGGNGTVYVNPSEEVIHLCKAKGEVEKEFKKVADEFKEEVTFTKDNVAIKLGVSCDNKEEIKDGISYGAEEIAIYETKHSYTQRKVPPTEDALFEEYREVVQMIKSQVVCFCTLHEIDIEKVEDIQRIKKQLRALYRTSKYGKIRILLPFISTIDGMQKMVKLLDEVKRELVEEAYSIDEKTEIGIVMYSPGIAMSADIVSRFIDFAYIDMDEMLQYSIAIECKDKSLVDGRDSFDIGYLRILSTCIKKVREKNKWVCVMGKRGCEPLMLPLLITMGVEKFVIPKEMIARTRWEISKMERKSWLEVEKMIAMAHVGREIKENAEKCYNQQLFLENI